MPEKVQLNVLLPERLNRQIRVVAEVDDQKLSATVGEAISQYVERRSQDPSWRRAYAEWEQEQRARLCLFPDVAQQDARISPVQH